MNDGTQQPEVAEGQLALTPEMAEAFQQTAEHVEHHPPFVGDMAEEQLEMMRHVRDEVATKPLINPEAEAQPEQRPDFAKVEDVEEGFDKVEEALEAIRKTLPAEAAKLKGVLDSYTKDKEREWEGRLKKQVDEIKRLDTKINTCLNTAGEQIAKWKRELDALPSRQQAKEQQDKNVDRFQTMESEIAGLKKQLRRDDKREQREQDRSVKHGGKR